MHSSSALRRKRNEILATIAAYEARIADAKMDLAALEQTARLFEAERDETAIPLAMNRVAFQLAGTWGADHRDLSPFASMGVREQDVTKTIAHPDTTEAPDEFIYLNWP